MVSVTSKVSATKDPEAKSSTTAMSVSDLVNLLGGPTNVNRVLFPNNQLVIEIHDTSLVNDGAPRYSLEEVLGKPQLTFDMPEHFDDSSLLELGSVISQQQVLKVEAVSKPVDCEHRPSWHVSPPQGLLNDPNGFIYHNGEYHLFYQWYPYACVHKDKYWAHLSSKDLINWEWQPLALTPSDWFDSHGVFSGHALSQGEQLMLFYTGNTRIGNQRDRHTTQCLAVSNDGITFEKLGPVIPNLPKGVTPHIRDPKIVRHGEHWLMLLGAQTTDLKGRLAIYRSSDLHQWEFVSLCGDEMGDFGYMWECPDLFELDGEHFAIVGPQGIESDSAYHTIPHHNGYVKAELDLEGKISLKDFDNLDKGFDFYAPQTMLAADGRRVLSGWMGLPDEINHPSSDNGWVHQLTALRELTNRNGRLVQTPIAEIATLRKEKQCFTLENSRYQSLSDKAFDMSLVLEWGSELRLHAKADQYVSIRLDETTRSLVFDRTHTLIREGDTKRELALTSKNVELRILSDESSLEIFVNGGEFVLTGRVFTDKDATGIELRGGASDFEVYPLNAASAPFKGSLS